MDKSNTLQVGLAAIRRMEELLHPEPIIDLQPGILTMKKEQVDHPDHYNKGGIECIDAIKEALPEEFLGFIKGQVLKYTWRAGHKDSLVQDLKKVQWYLDYWLTHIGEDGAQEEETESGKEQG